MRQAQSVKNSRLRACPLQERLTYKDTKFLGNHIALYKKEYKKDFHKACETILGIQRKFGRSL